MTGRVLTIKKIIFFTKLHTSAGWTVNILIFLPLEYEEFDKTK